LKGIFKILLFITLLLMLSMCKNSDADTVISYGKYSGITETGVDGPTPIGYVDPDDWYYNFDSTQTFQLEYAVYPAFPNPTIKNFSLRFSLAERGSVKIWVDDTRVDKKFQIFNETMQPGVHQLRVDLNDIEQNSVYGPGMLRVFVEFENFPDIPVIHGDVYFME